MKLPQPILHRLIRRKIALHTISTGRFEIRRVRSVEEYMDAFRLVHVSYLYQGIERLGPIDLRMTEQHVLPETIVLLAYEGDQPVGTVSITADSPAGLPLEADYPDAIEALRNQNQRLAEVGSFAVVKRCTGSGVAQLLSMAATRVAFRTFDATNAVIGVHPKAIALYQAMWGFTPLGPPRMHARLRAPVAGISAPREHTLAHFGRWFRRPMDSGCLPVEHLLEGPPLPCHLMGDDNRAANLSDLQMTRQVFQELFIEHSNRLNSLSPDTWAHLKRRRTDETLGITDEREHREWASSSESSVRELEPTTKRRRWV